MYLLMQLQTSLTLFIPNHQPCRQGKSIDSVLLYFVDVTMEKCNEKPVSPPSRAPISPLVPYSTVIVATPVAAESSLILTLE
jgi:hypothetical protein